MGCFQSKKETSDLHPNVFRVVNIDENGSDLCSGRLEITESDIILYREGRESTVWPLHSLRRYGFEGEIFSFESGRRCETGEGIYAFRCRRASLLFQTLQQQIQLRNVVHDTVSYPVTRLSSSSPQGRQTLQASVVHRSSVDNGQPDNGGATFNNNLSNIVSNTEVPPILTQSPRSPSSVDILEVMPLYPRSQASDNHVTNVYEVRDFKREHNNNQAEIGTDNRHVYTNDFNRDLAILRNNLKQEAVLNTIRDIEDETHFLENRYVNENVSNNLAKHVFSPTTSNSSEHYAQLSMEQQVLSRLYVNIPPDDPNILDSNKYDTTPITPNTSKQVEYCNLSIGTKPEVNVNTYANLILGDIADSVKNVKSLFGTSEHTQKFSESDTFTSMSPVEEIEVNYAILDIDSNKDTHIKVSKNLATPESQANISSKNESSASCSSHPHGWVVSQTSIQQSTAAKTPGTLPCTSIGYTTIDFDKTVALTSVAAGAELNVDCRKTRHNSCGILCGSPSSSEKNKGVN